METASTAKETSAACNLTVFVIPALAFRYSAFFWFAIIRWQGARFNAARFVGQSRARRAAAGRPLGPKPQIEHDLFRKPVPTFRDHALSFYLSMIFSENRFPLFGIMLYPFI
jgi:hypothetical protein